MNPTTNRRRPSKNSTVSTTSAERLTVPIPEAGTMLGVSRSTLYVLVGSGQIKAVKVGGRTLITTASIRALVEGLPEASIRRPSRTAA